MNVEYIKDSLIKNFRFLNKIKYSDLHLDFRQHTIVVGNKNTLPDKPIPKVIWTFWSQKSGSPFVDLCIGRWKVLHPDFQIIILNENNINDYIPCFNMEQYHLPIQNISDLIRLSVLDEYGGIWLDASIFLEERIDHIFDIYDNQYDLLGYYDKLSENRKLSPLIETWLLIAPPKSIIIHKWREELDECFASAQPTQYYKSRKDYPLLVENYEQIQDYMLVYIAQQVVLQYFNENGCIQLYQSEFGAAYVNHICGWNGFQIARFLLFQKYKNVNLPIVKVMGNARREIDRLMDRKCFRCDSYIGRFIKSKTE